VNKPEQVANILTSLRRDNYLSKTFEGTAKNGLLRGFYTKIALYNSGVVIGYVKIKGQYDLNEGNLKLDVAPSNLYWIVMALSVVVVVFLTYKGINQNEVFLMGSFLFLFMALGWTIAFVVESKRFMKHIHRIINLPVE